MRVLAHIHTFNDTEVIEQAVAALLAQTRPPDAIVVVDNGSTDATLAREFPELVTVIRHAENLGTSGGVRTGLGHALAHGFDWTLLLDADSVPEADAIETLLAFYDGLDAAARQRVCFLSCAVLTEAGQYFHWPMRFTDAGGAPATADPASGHYRCDSAIWSGSFYRMAAVARIGLPSDDYVLDWAELEYGYRALELGFESYMVAGARLRHDVGRGSGVEPRSLGLGRFRLKLFEVAPHRCYYRARNGIYFWLYQCRRRRPRNVAGALYRALLFAGNFALRPLSHRRQLAACLRGIRDGVSGHLERRY